MIEIRLKFPDIIRVFMAGLIFMGMAVMFGMDFRTAQQVFFTCGVIAIVSLMMKNFWITAFLLWTNCLFILYRFELGSLYLSNIFFGALLYLMTKLFFRREHVDGYLKVFLTFVGINLLFSVCQMFNWDFIFRGVNVEATEPCGFMAFRSAWGMLSALAIPVILTRPYKLALPMALGMFVPIYISDSSIAVIGGLAGFAVTLYYSRRYWKNWYKWRRQITACVALVALILGGMYVTKKDNFQSSFKTRAGLWKVCMGDSVLHPITGWGLDSFRNVTKDKAFNYVMNLKHREGQSYDVDIWDNPHNLYVSLALEWGWVGLGIAIGYIVFIFKRFMRSEKLPNTVALFGVCLVTMILSIAHFPMFLARFTAFLIPMFAMYETITEDI